MSDRESKPTPKIPKVKRVVVSEPPIYRCPKCEGHTLQLDKCIRCGYAVA